VNPTLTLAFSLILLAGAFGQTSQVPYDPTYGPTFANTEAHISYPRSYSSIRKVNFRKLAIADDEKSASKPRKEKHERRDPFDHFSITLDSIYYLKDTSGSKAGAALVVSSWIDGGGSTSQGGIADVFTLTGGHLEMVQSMNWDMHFNAGQPTESFDASTKTLIIRTAHYIPGDAHCCVSAMDVVTLKWSGVRFVQTSFQTELSAYGKREGKILPR
jgi:hypothetical protein